MQKRYFGFAKIRCQKCTWTYTFDDTFASLAKIHCQKMYKGSTFFDSTALQANSRALFFHAFLIYSGLLLFFTAESLSL